MTLDPVRTMQLFAEGDQKINGLKAERSALYRLIEGACDQLLGCKSARQAIDLASQFRTRAQQIRDGRTTDQTQLEDASGHPGA